jgi:Fur family transcriptional regulator, ferric uptake regulator
MCHQCDYSDFLKTCELEITENRLRVLEVLGRTNFPLSAGDIHKTLKRNTSINRVTVYRILDLFVTHGLVQRLSGGGRSFVYGLGPNPFHPPHPHFYCKSCGNLECLNPQSLTIDTETMQRTFAGLIERVEVRVDGLCKNCLKTAKNALHQ